VRPRPVLKDAGHRTPAGHWPLDARYPHVVVAGCSLACTACGARASAPLPRDVAAYNAAAARFLEAHKRCSDREATA
jgi:hypothetical protein